jgi:hypothetical protein
MSEKMSQYLSDSEHISDHLTKAQGDPPTELQPIKIELEEGSLGTFRFTLL